MKLIFLILSLISFNLSAAPAPADAQYIWNGNYLNNPSFEEGRSGWTLTDGVINFANGGTNLKRFVQITLDGETLDFYQDFSLPPGLVGKRIFLSFDISTALIGADISVCSSADTIEQECIAYADSGDWESLQVSLTVGAVNRITLKSDGTITGVVSVDNGWAGQRTSGGGGSGEIPADGGINSVLIKTSVDEAEVDWDQMACSGFSARFNQDFTSTDLRDTIQKILNFQYLAPQVSLSGSSNSLREKGDTVSSITLSATVTKRSDPIARIRFLEGVNEIADYDPPTNTGSGVTTAPYNTPFSDNITFSVQVTDNGDTGGPSTVSSNTTYSFVYPYYHGVGAQGFTPAQVATLTKSIINSNANLTRSFGAASGEVYYFAYPASYGALTEIYDENNFNVFSSWTLSTENITGLDGNPVSYRIYEFDNVVSAGATTFRFVR
jgi:hypothetical protein